MEANKNAYATKAISQIPRLLSMLDRNPFSPTYGCFHRDYWLFKTSDFPDAVRQFGVHALALVYNYDFPGNTYKGQPKIRDWTLAAMRFWCSIQHKDGSFDEFYPYERGWVGPTAFTTYTMIEAYKLMQDEMPEADKNLLLVSISKAAYFIGAGESEADHLANHHAMACLTLSKAARILDDDTLKGFYFKAWQKFLSYHKEDEGWSMEYDGIDPGYLSATVSFLAKIYTEHPSEEMLHILKQSVDMSAYFAYPNGFYAGSTGSRNTLHFYPHGYEILAQTHPMAAAVAEKMLHGLNQNKLVPPEIMADRYVFYRVPELLLAYLDYQERPEQLPALPHQKPGFTKFFKEAKIFVQTTDSYYLLVNLAKGGVIKLFNTSTQKLTANDAGILGQLKNGKVYTSQWIDPAYKIENASNEIIVEGYMNEVPSNKLFTPFKLILFRSALIAMGWIPAFAHFLKAQIRKVLILGQRKSKVHFRRHIDTQNLMVTDTLQVHDNTRFKSMMIGDEFFVRYVPQSRYFQSQEFDASGYTLSAKELQELNTTRKLVVHRSLLKNSNQTNTISL